MSAVIVCNTVVSPTGLAAAGIEVRLQNGCNLSVFSTHNRQQLLLT